MKTVTWRREYEFLYNGADAQKVADEIVSIGDSATPRQIVDKAMDERTELHKCFEWDNDVAADKYRLQQARYITHHLVIEERFADNDNKPPIRFLVQTSQSEGYKPIERVFRQDDEYQKLLARAMAELRAFKQKYSRLSELSEIFDLIP